MTKASPALLHPFLLCMLRIFSPHCGISHYSSPPHRFLLLLQEILWQHIGDEARHAAGSPLLSLMPVHGTGASVSGAWGCGVPLQAAPVPRLQTDKSPRGKYRGWIFLQRARFNLTTPAAIDRHLIKLLGMGRRQTRRDFHPQVSHKRCSKGSYVLITVEGLCSQ